MSFLFVCLFLFVCVFCFVLVLKGFVAVSATSFVIGLCKLLMSSQFSMSGSNVSRNPFTYLRFSNLMTMGLK